jgi:hypothetical protein
MTGAAYPLDGEVRANQYQAKSQRAQIPLD